MATVLSHDSTWPRISEFLLSSPDCYLESELLFLPLCPCTNQGVSWCSQTLAISGPCATVWQGNAAAPGWQRCASLLHFAGAGGVACMVLIQTIRRADSAADAMGRGGIMAAGSAGVGAAASCGEPSAPGSMLATVMHMQSVVVSGGRSGSAAWLGAMLGLLCRRACSLLSTWTGGSPSH